MYSVSVASLIPARSLPRAGENLLFPVLLALCAIVTALAAAGPLAGLFDRTSIDYGEGWNAYWAAAAMGAGPLYSKAHILVANNYPPLSFYVNGLVGLITGDDVIAGRLVATASTLAVAGLIAVIVRRTGAPWRWGIAAAILFLGYDILYFSQFLAVNNPQWLGQAVMLAGLLPLIGPRALTGRRIVVAAGIMILAGLVKHNQFALPLAVTLWLLARDRRAFGIWIAAGIGWAALAGLLLYACYGSAVFVELLQFKRTTNIVNFVSGLRKMGCFAALTGVALLVLRTMRGGRRVLPLILYAVLGLVLGALQRLGSGVYINAHFDALIGLTILCGVALGRAARRNVGPDRATRSALLLVLVAPLALIASSHVGRSFRQLRERPDRTAAWESMIADVHNAHGPVLCEVPVVCYWAGRPFSLDFFAYGQKLRTGTDPRPLAGLIEGHRPALIILDPAYNAQSGEGRLPVPFPALMRANYHVVRTVPYGIEERAPNAG
ncbi:hypothetical protein HZF05_16740 [Sphingomonas sp. CGMCC 1.13654]|uniref:Glycosyltransferase RgtA/B/C/D-like domain-containing protein n=1 Tax=Sphingomonas chungangi TaxID=2683589 RepID=A0A838L8E4_9SPHN|nr:glycosyltransferase family 39 protein [Sphingomonas chungangi]MBA2935733.1 hypothetical protein [Sphingomonas chungangi]MVW54423.1 hypothetical protein [Sphingomonas chungangi]